jgi:hypothetical protein
MPDENQSTRAERVAHKLRMDPVMALTATALTAIAITAAFMHWWFMVIVSTGFALLIAYRARHWGKMGFTTWR